MTITSGTERTARAATFQGNGGDYERYRPGFPAEAVRAIREAAGGQLRRVLDVGAGTGKLTEALVPAAHSVGAVDPSGNMLAQLHRKLPAVRTWIGSAEALPLPEASEDVITVAQAFHWFDRDAACAEFTRVLVPGGTLALVWTLPDPACEWDRACFSIVAPPRSATPVGTPSAASAGRLQAPLPGFAARGITRVAWSERVSRADYLRRFSTYSAVLAASEEGRAELFRRMEAVLDSHPETRGRTVLTVRHVTEVEAYRAA